MQGSQPAPHPFMNSFLPCSETDLSFFITKFLFIVFDCTREFCVSVSPTHVLTCIKPDFACHFAYCLTKSCTRKYKFTKLGGVYNWLGHLLSGWWIFHCSRKYIRLYILNYYLLGMVGDAVPIILTILTMTLRCIRLIPRKFCLRSCKSTFAEKTRAGRKYKWEDSSGEEIQTKVVYMGLLEGNNIIDLRIANVWEVAPRK